MYRFSLLRVLVLCSTAALLVLNPILGQARDDENGSHRAFTVMTQNMFQGSELVDVLTAATFPDFVKAVAKDYQEVVDSKPRERAAAFAAEIKTTRPDLVGLQEAALWQKGPSPAALTTTFDLVGLLVEELAKLQLDYKVVKVVDNFTASAPAGFGPGGVPTPWVRFADRDAIIARADAVSRLQLTNPQGANYAAAAVVPTLIGPQKVLDGWASVDGTLHGKQFRFVTTHLAALDAGVQPAQVSELLAKPGSTTSALIVTGDFNSEAGIGSAYLHMVAAGLVDTWGDVQEGEPGFTCCHFTPTEPLTQRIDFVFAGRGVRAESDRLLGTSPNDLTPSGLWPSDHAGLVAELS